MITNILKLGYKIYLLAYLFYAVTKLVFKEVEILTKNEWLRKRYDVIEKIK